MRGTPTLAVVLAPAVDAGVEEFLRLCVGFVAGGGKLTLLEAGPGRGLLSAGDAALPDESARNLAGLADFGILPVPVSDEELRDLLRGSERVLRVASSARTGVPDLLVLDDALLESADPVALSGDLASAGQVLRLT